MLSCVHLCLNVLRCAYMYSVHVRRVSVKMYAVVFLLRSELSSKYLMKIRVRLIRVRVHSSDGKLEISYHLTKAIFSIAMKAYAYRRCIEAKIEVVSPRDHHHHSQDLDCQRRQKTDKVA